MNSSSSQACRSSLDVLTSDEHGKKNYLFLMPVDTSYIPDYAAKISRPMDLGTVRRKLDGGQYSSPSQFWADVDLTFQNALTYHKDRKDTQHVMKYAKDMMKLVNREKKKYTSPGGATAPKKSAGLKLKLSSGKKAEPKLSLKLKNPAAASTEAEVPAKPAKPKLKLSLSLNKSKSSGDASSAAPSKPQKIRLTAPPAPAASGPVSKPQKIRLSAPTAPAAATAPAPKPSAAPKPPKIRLSAAPTPAPPTAAPKPPKIRLSAPPAPAPPAKPAGQKIRINAAPTRGKELPKGVAPTPIVAPAAAPAAAPAPPKPQTKPAVSTTVSPGAKPTGKGKQKKTTTKKEGKTKTKKSTPKGVPKPPMPAPTGGRSEVMTADRRARCLKVLSGLKRRQHKNCIYFLQPVSDKAFVDDYKAKIPNPMDLGTMTTKLEKDQYNSIAEFATDLRRVFGNCLRFNTTKHDSFRPIAVQMLKTAEELLAFFLAKPEAPNQVYPSLLYCWELCVNLIDLLLNVSNPSNGHQTAHYFMHPASYFFGGSFPGDYLSKIAKPMDFGTVTSNLIEGCYQSISAFSADCRLVIDNCLTYYGGRADGAEFSQQATHLKALVSQQVEALTLYNQSDRASKARKDVVSWQNVSLAKPPESLLLGILKDLRNLQFTDKQTKISQPAMRPFEKPVDMTVYRDYLQFAPTPMDLETVERKVKAGAYETPEDFEYDVQLIFKNCEAYNAPRRTEQMIAMGKFGAKEFRRLFMKRMKAYENPEENPKKRSASPGAVTATQVGGKSAKRMKAEASDPATGKLPRAATPKISITASSSTTVAVDAPSKSTKTSKTSKSPVNTSGVAKIKDTPERDPNQPVPLHVAIADVKSRYPLRRPLKLLEEWEASCAKFFKDLMKHPWISAARPKFIFHVPVDVIFPALKQAYLSKVKRPMDLTTVEAKLLQGGLYYSAQDFVDDVALVFANAITFNKAGRDEGDHLSIAYYDASIHLLKYARWLSLENLQRYLTDEPHVDEDSPDGIPPTGWKLNHANREKARKEMEQIVVNEHIDKSVEGDRFPATWMESECEKLLKALRHQSDHKHMKYFILPAYPPDYTAYIAKPMDWDRIQKNLRKRKYVQFGEVIDDVRLIFTNALKYNAQYKDKDPISAAAYDAANFMSVKLESAIDKMMLTVSDRLGREKVEHDMDEREADAAERAEEERIRQAIANGEIQSQPQSGGGRAETVETVRVAHRRLAPRREIDMDVPFFDNDENPGQAEAEATRQHRATFDKQQQQRKEQNTISRSLAALVFGRHIQSEQATKWVSRMAKVMAPNPIETKSQQVEESMASNLGSSVAAELNKNDRVAIKMQPKKISRKRKFEPPPAFSLE